MKKSKAKSHVGIVVFLVVLVACIVGCFAYLAKKPGKDASSSSLSTVQTVLSRDLEGDYPPTPKEVLKYFTEIQKCFYNEKCTEEEIEQLGMKARELYDDELLAANETEFYLSQLKAEISTFKKNNRRINSVSVAYSVNVDFFEMDGRECAKLQCAYSILNGGKSEILRQVYVLRRDENRRWKIYGWDLADNAAQ